MPVDVIYSYSRKQAIADGVLVDVTKVAQEAGIKYPVAVTSALWASLIKPSPELEVQGQSFEGRLWDLLFMFAFYAQTATSSTLIYECLFQMYPSKEPELHKIKAVIGPGDTLDPVITIMFPEED
jgi:hypothetical protein